VGKKKKQKLDKKADKAEKRHRTEEEFARLRADKIEALAKAIDAEEERKRMEEESEELISIAAKVGEKLEAARPHLERLRASLAVLLPLPDASTDAGPWRALSAAFDLATTLTGPLVPEARTVRCGAPATFQSPDGATELTSCWADHSHEGTHGDAQGRSW